jgi:hypothetical protein
VPTERDPDPWITPLEAAEWLAYRARDATEDPEAAVEQRLLPALRAGRLTAGGREGCAGEHREIPLVRWAKAELDVLAAEGGRLWLRHEPRRGPLWDQVLFPREAILELWPAREVGGGAGLGGEAVYRSGLPGQPSSIHLVEAELDRRVAAGRVWKSKAQCGEELAAWLRRAHPLAPRATAKTIINRLRDKIPIAQN